MGELFREETKDIFRIFVPFESVYTSVFLIRSRNILIDCGTYASDIDEYVLPALKEIGVSIDDIQYILLTHSHTDHSGGLNALLQRCNPDVRVITAENKDETPMDDLKLVHLKGHSEDCIGVVDIKTNSLISGDGIQLYGIGKYGCGIQNPREYLRTLDWIENQDFDNILASHAYALLGEKAVQKSAVKKYIKEARENFLFILAFIQQKFFVGEQNVESIQRSFCKSYPGLPKLQCFTIQAIMEFIKGEQL